MQTLTDGCAINVKRVACIGAGYVGGPAMAILAYKCPDVTVTVLDISDARVQAWNSDQLPIYEPGLTDLVKACRGVNLFFSTDAKKHLAEADLIFVCVNTPTKLQGVGAGKAATFGFWEAAARLIAASCQGCGPKIIAEKSPVPVKTAQAMSRVLSGCQDGEKTRFEVISNPEFMSAGTAVEDCLKPDRVLIGGRDTPEGRAAVESLARLYRRWVPPDRVLSMGLWSSELAKLAANAFLAQRISSINAISALCEETGADVQQVSHAIGTDSRIGPRFLSAGCGFGGPALQKHVLNLVYICESLGLTQEAAYWQQVVDMNDWIKARFVRRVITSMFNTIRGKRIAVLGFSYKAHTTDTRDTASTDVCRGLLLDGAALSVYDPKVSPEQIHLDMCLPKGSLEQPRRQHTAVSLATVDVARSAMEACRGAHGVCVLTDWPEFRRLDFPAIFKSMMKPAFIFDGRNVLDHARLREIGFVVYALGKPLDPFLTQKLEDVDLEERAELRRQRRVSVMAHELAEERHAVAAEVEALHEAEAEVAEALGREPDRSQGKGAGAPAEGSSGGQGAGGKAAGAPAGGQEGQAGLPSGGQGGGGSGS
ncbi:hypothetical protein HYH02_001604 [Chlamydomonas schloesseri]|uniref:UDP-glucose 6-dehydrogenase n=1 Tax=Chlamydomonas schloesseri TaxID=2026947 RepID=A0A836BBZ3_9CHLO|nr:hypothetical protein HYH02_001604 [Chlamydomonas schloesseri]|eukprot:KAG2453380.1 hypothetical protein HYH02_001604 [Chlamydomonas schloesseri]